MSAESIRDGLINMGVVPHWADLVALILEAEIEASNRGEKVERSHTQQRVISLAWQQYETRAIHNPDT